MNHDLDPRYRKAEHSDFKNMTFSENTFISGKGRTVDEVPGGWLITTCIGSSVGAGVAISTTFIPFPSKYILKEKI